MQQVVQSQIRGQFRPAPAQIRSNLPSRHAINTLSSQVAPMAHISTVSTSNWRSIIPQTRSIARKSRPTKLTVQAVVSSLPETNSVSRLAAPGRHLNKVNVVYKFGGSSVRDAERMREVADIICSFPDNLPCVVLSAMGKTTNLLLECGAAALHTSTDDIPKLQALRAIRELHMSTCEELGLEASVRGEVETLLQQLQQLLVGISILQDVTPRAKDSLVSFGERMSTRIFASYLRSLGVAAKQYDAWELGIITTDDFCNADVLYEPTLPVVRAKLEESVRSDWHVPIVTGFLGKGEHTGAITTLGRGGSDLTATVLGAAMNLEEVQVWKDVDGVLTCDPRIVDAAQPVPKLTYDEATELAFFGAQVLHPQAMQPAIRHGALNVRVKNSYNREAEGTIITADRDLSNTLVTSIVVKKNIALVDVVSTRMLGQYGFLAKVFNVFQDNKISVDVVATSEVSVSVTLDPRKVWDDTQVEQELASLVHDFKGIAQVSTRTGLAIISLICNVGRTSEILHKVFQVLMRDGVTVKMISQGASKTNISLVVDSAVANTAVQALHNEFFV